MKNYFWWCISSKITFLMVPWWWSFLWGYLQWMPPRLEQVHEEAVEHYFSKIDDPRWEHLNLPPKTFVWKKYWVQALIEVLGNDLNKPRWWSKQHIISSLESLCRLETTDETKVNMPHRSPFITTQTLCCLFMKLYLIYNSYSRPVVVMISFVSVTAHEICMRNQRFCHHQR